MVDDLCGLIRQESVTPQEFLCLSLIRDRLTELGIGSLLEPLHHELQSHRDYTDHPHSIAGPERCNLRAEWRGAGPGARTVAFSAHVDVVPPSPEDASAFAPHFDGRRVHGRGACDTKNNIVMLLTAFELLRLQDREPNVNVVLDFVIEEEIGGNGALSTLLFGLDADEIIVLEPTDLAVYTGHRGCLTFTINVTGRSVHMGGDSTGVSAIEGAIEVIESLERLERRLLEAAKEHPAFADWERPVQVNIGMIEGGEWSGSVPERCLIRGDLGFLPTHSIDAARQLVKEAIEDVDSKWVRDHSTVTFDGLHNDAYLAPEAEDLAARLDAAVARQGVEPPRRPRGWKVSCDGRLYHHVGGLPTVIFGSGSLDDAHSAHEQVEVEQMILGAAAIADLLTSG